MPVTSTLPPEKYKIFTDSRNEFRALPSVDERNALIDRRKAECIRLYGPFEDDEEGKVNQYYYNQTYTKNKKKKNKPSKRSDSSEPSTSQVLLNKAWTGRDVYWAANGSRGGQINEEVNEERTANGVSHLRHVGLLNKALAKGWGELPPEEKGIWDKEADNMNADETKKILEAPDAVVNQEIEAAFEKLRKKFGVVYFAFFVAVPDPKGEPLLIHRSNAPSKFDNINRTQVGERFFNRFSDYAKEVFTDAGLKKSTTLEWDSQANKLNLLELKDYLEKYLTEHYRNYCDSTFNGDSLPFEDFEKNPERYLIEPKNRNFIKDPNEMTTDELPALISFFAATPVFFKKVNITPPLATEPALESTTEHLPVLPTPTPAAGSASHQESVLDESVLESTALPLTERPPIPPTPMPPAGSTSSQVAQLSTPAKVRRVFEKGEEKPVENQQSPDDPETQDALKPHRGKKRKPQEDVASGSSSKKAKKQVAPAPKAQKDKGEGPSKKSKKKTKTPVQTESTTERRSARERHQVDRSKPLESLSGKTGTDAKAKPGWDIVLQPISPPKARLPM